MDTAIPRVMNRREFRRTLLPGVARLMAAGLLFALASAAIAAGPPFITPQALDQRITAGDGPAVLDVRSEEEFASGHIPGAINIPITELKQRVGELATYKDTRVVVHCELGPRADVASRFLQSRGFTGVVELEGHMRAWRDAGLPMAR